MLFEDDSPSNTCYIASVDYQPHRGILEATNNTIINTRIELTIPLSSKTCQFINDTRRSRRTENPRVIKSAVVLCSEKDDPDRKAEKTPRAEEIPAKRSDHFPPVSARPSWWETTGAERGGEEACYEMILARVSCTALGPRRSHPAKLSGVDSYARGRVWRVRSGRFDRS